MSAKVEVMIVLDALHAAGVVSDVELGLAFAYVNSVPYHLPVEDGGEAYQAWRDSR